MRNRIKVVKKTRVVPGERRAVVLMVFSIAEDLCRKEENPNYNSRLLNESRTPHFISKNTELIVETLHLINKRKVGYKPLFTNTINTIINKISK